MPSVADVIRYDQKKIVPPAKKEEPKLPEWFPTGSAGQPMVPGLAGPDLGNRWDENKYGPDEVWAFDDEYPEEAKAGLPSMNLTPFGARKEETPRVSRFGTEGLPVQAQQSQVAWLGNQANTVAEMAVRMTSPATLQEVSEAVDEHPFAVLWEGLKGTGNNIAKVFNFGLNGASLAAKRGVGWLTNMGLTGRPAQMTGGTAIMWKYAALRKGNYTDVVAGQIDPANWTDAEISHEIAAAREAQHTFTKTYNILRSQGLSEDKATLQAADAAFKMEKSQNPLPAAVPIFEGKATSENPIPFSEQSKVAWAAAEGYRYTHSVDPRAAAKYEKLIDSGIGVKEAAAATEDVVIEAVGEALIDPNWVLAMDNLVLSAAGQVIKPLASGLLDVGLKIPGVRGGIQWAVEMSTRTMGNVAARHADEAMRWVGAYIEKQGGELTADAVAALIKNPPPELLATMDSAARRALEGAQPWADDIVRGINTGMGREAYTDILSEVLEEAKRKGVTITDEVAHATAKVKAWEKGLEKGAGNAYSAAMETAMLAQEQAHPFITRLGKLTKGGTIRNGLGAVVTYSRGMMVDTWLGLRPSWNVFNYVDNLVKLLSDGVSPLTDIGRMAERYASYMPGDVGINKQILDNALAIIKKDRVWNLSTKSMDDFVGAMRVAAPREAMGTFGGELVAATRGTGGRETILGKTGVVRWNRALGSKIESSFRARAYYHHFFKQMDEGWGQLVNRAVSGQIGGQTVTLNPKISSALKQKLMGIRNPTPENVAAAVNSMVIRDRGVVIAPNLGADMADQLTEIPADIKTFIVDRLNGLVDDVALQGRGAYQHVVNRMEVRRVFDEAGDMIGKSYNQALESGRRAFYDSLPTLPQTGDEMVATLLPAGDAATIEDVFKAVEDMPVMAHRATLDSQAMNQAHNMNIAKLKLGLREGKNTVQDIANAHEAFYRGAHKKFWDDFVTTQRDAFEKLADRADSLVKQRVTVRGVAPSPVTPVAITETMRGDLKALGYVDATIDEMTPLDAQRALNKTTPSSGVAQEMPVSLFPRDEMRKYLEAAEQITAHDYEEMGIWTNVMKELRRGGLDQASRDELVRIGRYEADRLWRNTLPKAKAAIHDSIVGMRTWFLKSGMEVDKPLSMVELSKGAGWWRLGQQIEDIPVAAKRQIAPMIRELRAWSDEVMDRRITPLIEETLGDTDMAVLKAYGSQLQDDVYRLVSGARTTATQEVNDLLFDYEKTQNWMGALGKIFPFVRFPSKNIPWWINKFTEVPHLAGTVVHIRQIQAALNKDLPARMRYTVPVPFSEELMSVLGFDNTQLRFNPWSFISFMQQVPGATEFSRRQMEELRLDEDDKEGVQFLRSTNTVLTEMGFGMWPYLEYALGSRGLLGRDWYPRDALGTWSPLVNLALREAFGYDQNYDIDAAMRENLPNFWNAIWGNFLGGRMQWNQLNPTLMEDWAMGREIEGLIMALPDEAAASLVQVTPQQAREIVKTMNENDLRIMTQQSQEIFTMEPAAQAEIIMAMTPQQQAVFMLEMEVQALRVSMRKRALTTVLGNMTGLYASGNTKTEAEARALRYERQQKQESMEPGAERRDYMSAWYEEHPKYTLIQNWRFAETPWAETASGKEAEIWDAVQDQYKSQYYDYNREYNRKLQQAVEASYREHPGDNQRLKIVKAELYAQKEAYTAQLNEKMKKEIEGRMLAYIQEYPEDKEGIEMLRKGWNVPVYQAVTLTSEDRIQLRKFKQVAPDDVEGYQKLYQSLYSQRSAEQPETVMKKVPGLDTGINLDLKWSPVGNVNYTDDEVQNFLVGDILGKLRDGMPDKDDYEDTKEWWVAYNTYLDTLQDEAMKLPEVQSQVNKLVIEQGMSAAQAEAVVKDWYTKEDLQESWRRNDSPWEALEYAYQWAYISEADDEFYDKVLPLQEKDYDEYAMAREDLAGRFGKVSAVEMVKYILQEYPGRWTQAELEIMFRGVMLPSYFERMTIRQSGAKAVDSNIWRYYNQLSDEQKTSVRQAYGPLFQDFFLKGDTEGVSLSLRGAWLNSLADLYGEDMDWRMLPGVEKAIQQTSKEKWDAGLPNVEAPDMKEFLKAQEVNHTYWEYRAAGDARATALENDPLRQKYFGATNASSYFWDMYYTKIPPGTFSKVFRDNGIMSMIVGNDKTIRNVIATNSDYDRATEFMENWLLMANDAMMDAGIDPDDFEKVRELMDQYYDIPSELSKQRKAFKMANPLLQLYMDIDPFG